MRRTEFRGPRATSTFGVEPHRIDILNTIDGVAFDDASPQRMIIRINDLDSPVIGLQELIENKRAVGRTKDLADIEQLEREAGGPRRPRTRER